MAKSDISFSLECLIRLNKLNHEPNSDPVIREALWDAAVVRLFVAFDTGRYALDRNKILNQLPDGAREGFEFFSDYRAKHVAHKANPLDEIKVGVLLSGPSSEKNEVVSIGHMTTGDAHFSDSHWIGSLSKLAHALLKQIEKEIELWSGRVVEEAKARRIADLYRLPPMRMVPSVIGKRDSKQE